MYTSKERQNSLILFIGVILGLLMLVGCGPTIAELEAVDYTPLPRYAWEKEKAIIDLVGQFINSLPSE